ncbi:MAG TPA: HD domain-containing protein [Gemmatimonadales bacterium]
MRPFEVVRDPLWDNITLDEAALGLVDSAPFQRLRYVRQLGHAFLVYPGATHGRFEHALGAYHLTKQALAALEIRGELTGISEDDRLAVTLAALLHDVGHYPFSHALEEAGFPSHEAQGEARLQSGVLHERLVAIGGDGFPARVADLIRTRSASPLQGLISGTLDLDKIDYLCRDSRMCGVPYGTVDVDRLLASITMVQAGPLGQRTLGVQEKGVSALESLLFAKYQMYRNVYWHHAVRSATCMFKRAGRTAVANGSVTRERVAALTDDELMHLLIERERSPLARALRERRLYKRALDLPGSEVEAATPEWVAEEPELLGRVEDALALEVGLHPGELLLDFPSRHSMLGVDLPLKLRDGGVERLTDEGRAGHLGLPRIAQELYRSARRLRVFVARPVRRSVEGVVGLVALGGAEVSARIEAGKPLLD